MAGLKKVFTRELYLMWREPKRLVFAVVLPLFFFWFFMGLFQSGVPRDMPIAVVDYDQSALSRQLTEQLSATPEIAVKALPSNDLEAKRLIETGQVYAMVVIPEDFQADVRSGRSVKLVNFTNGAFLLPSGLISRAYQKTVGTLSAGVSIQTRMKRGAIQEQAMVSMRPIGLSSKILFNPYGNYSYYLNTGLLPMMLQLFVMLTTIYSVGKDLKYHQGRSLYRLGEQSILSVVWGKLLPYTLLFFIVGMLMNFAMFLWEDFPLNGSKALVVLATLLFILAHQALGVYFAAGAKSLRAALTSGTGFSAVSMSFAGLTFPDLGMPLPIQWLSKVFPLTHYLSVMIDQGQRGAPVYYSLPALGALLLLVLLPMLGWLKLRKLYAAGAYPERV